MNEHLLTNFDNGLATITFNRPDVRNALSSQMIQEIGRFVLRIREEPSARCMVFRGVGAHFSAGGDVRNFSTMMDQSPEERSAGFEFRAGAVAPLFEALDNLSIPTVAVVRGAVAGGGMAFALAADFTIASETSLFIIAQTKLGLAMDSALSYHLPRVVGIKRAKALAISGRRVGAAEAAAIGIITTLTADDELDRTADELIAELMSAAPQAIAETKKLLHASVSNDVTAQVALEAGAVGRTVASADFKEGVLAFMERRAAVFSGL